jgi:DNA-binding transcriptional MocR family regulator
VQVIQFTRGVPARESLPVREVEDASREAIRTHGPALLQYGPSPGFLPLREWLAAAHGVGPDQVVVGNGSLQLLELLCVSRFRAGDRVITEVPTYDRTLTLLRRHAIRPVGVPLVDDGADLRELERAIRERRPRALYLIPDFQNPSGVTWSTAKRRRVAELAEEHDLLIVEDSPYRALRYRGEERPSLLSLCPTRTLYMSSFSKLLGPGPRVGYMVGPPDVVWSLAKAAEDSYICPNNLAHGIAYEWCRSGRLAPQLQRLKALYAPRLEACRRAVAEHLSGVKASSPEGGFFLSIELPAGSSARAVRAAAKEHALEIADGEAFFPEGGGERFLRLPFCALTPEEISEGVRRLAAATRQLQGAALPA